MNGNKIYTIKYLSLLGLLLLLSQPLQATEWGNLAGQFIYTGKLFKPKKIKVTKHKEICDNPEGHIVDQSLLIGKNGGIKNIFIYMRNTNLPEKQIHTSYKLLPDQVDIEQINCVIKPHALGLWYKHQKLIGTNADPLAHNFHLYPLNNQLPCSALPPRGKHTFDFYHKEPLPVKITCDIHPWETAYLLVHQNPYFSITDNAGSFTIKNIPIGDWEFQLWHEKTGYLIAKEDWNRGRIKIKIKSGNNDLGVIKVSPKLFQQK